MCCCFKTRKQPAIAITILSSLVLICGIVIAFLAYRFAVSDSFFKVKTLQGVADVDFDKFTKYYFYIQLGAGCIAILTGFFGFFFTCCKKMCYVHCFGTFLTFTWMIILSLGSAATYASYGSQ